MIRAFPVLALVLLTSCGRSPMQPPQEAAEAAQTSPDTQAVDAASRSEEQRVVAEDAPQTDAQKAADVLRKYFQLLTAKQFDAAAQLCTPSGRDTMQTFVQQFGEHGTDDVRIGEPGRIEGAAGSLYVSIPVQIVGRSTTGEDVRSTGEATLRRSNNVPGSTPEQLSWRIAGISIR